MNYFVNRFGEIYVIYNPWKHALDRIIKEVGQIKKMLNEKRQTVTVTNKYGREIATLYNALPSCDHEIVDGDNWSGIKCKKCGGWYCA